MIPDPRLNDTIKQLQEKVNELKALSAEMRSKSKKRTDEEIQADLNIVLNEMSALHEKANKIMQRRS